MIDITRARRTGQDWSSRPRVRAH